MFPFAIPAVGGMMQGLLGSGAASGGMANLVGQGANAASGIGLSNSAPNMATLVGQSANEVSKMGMMPNAGGMTTTGQNQQNTQMPMVQANPSGDPLMSKNSLLNGIGGPLMQFFGMGGQ